MSISIIIPLYNEEKNISVLLDQFSTIALPPLSEIILVNDGSTDDTESMVKNSLKTNDFLKLISFADNQGQTAAIKAGIDVSSGEVIVIMDGDLQFTPKDIPVLVSKIHEGYDLVSGRRVFRKDHFFTKVLPSRIANFVLQIIFKHNCIDLAGMNCLRTEFAKKIPLEKGYHRFIPLLVHLNGGCCTEIPISHFQRKSGKSNYTLLPRVLQVIKDVYKIWRTAYHFNNS